MEHAILAQSLTKNYGPLHAIEDVSLRVRQGTAFGLLGANGAGKSTTIECILGTKTPDSGNVSVLGLNPKQHRKQLFERVGVQFQEASYQDKITVEELCQMTACLYQRATSYPALLAQFGIADKRKKQIETLSGGERQRLFIVLALIPNPEVVFLDELTTGLDARARRDVWQHLSRLKQEGMTMLLTSHFMDEIEALCDEICILKKGRIVFYGTVPEAVQKSPCDTFEDAYLWYTDEEEA